MIPGHRKDRQAESPRIICEKTSGGVPTAEMTEAADDSIRPIPSSILLIDTTPMRRHFSTTTMHLERPTPERDQHREARKRM